MGSTQPQTLITTTPCYVRDSRSSHVSSFTQICVLLLNTVFLKAIEMRQTISTQLILEFRINRADVINKDFSRLFELNRRICLLTVQLYVLVCIHKQSDVYIFRMLLNTQETVEPMSLEHKSQGLYVSRLRSIFQLFAKLMMTIT